MEISTQRTLTPRDLHWVQHWVSRIGLLSEASCPEMLRGQSCFQLSAVEPITVSQTQSRSEETHSGPLHCVVFHWRIFIFDFKMSPELWFHSSKGEAFPNIGESQRWNTLPRPGMFAMFCSVAIIVAAHVVLGVAWRISSMMQRPRCSVLEELWKCCSHVQRASTRGYVAVLRCIVDKWSMCPLDMLWLHDQILWHWVKWVVTIGQPSSCEYLHQLFNPFSV